MRDESLTLRILVLAVALPSAAVVCVIALAATGTLRPHVAQMVAAGGAILIVAVLAAALSAFSPKYRPTPLLTPLFAGVFAALLATTAIYAVHAHVAPKRDVVAAVQTKPPVHPVKTAPVIENALVEPDVLAEPQKPSMQPSFDSGAFVAPAKAQGEVHADAQPLPKDTADRTAMGGPLVDLANAAVPSAKAEGKAAAPEREKKPSVVVAKIPALAAAPEASAEAAKADPDAPLNLATSFDPTGPTVPAAEGPPIPLDAAVATDETTPKHTAIPPLPRIRPCGGGGPACP